MDLQSALAKAEGVLPTLEQNLSTGTLAGPSLPVITADASTYLKFGGGAVMSLLGMVCLGYGKRNGDVRQMVIGAALTLGSIFVF